MAPLTAPAGAAASARRQRLGARVASTPGRLTLMMAVLSLAGLFAGVAALVGTVQRAGLVDAVRTRSGPLTVHGPAALPLAVRR